MNLKYYKRIFGAYVTNKDKSNLCFWHTSLKANLTEDYTKLGKYYMDFSNKTGFSGPFDQKGVPMLDYKGDIGIQYNPNAIAQYALGNYDLLCDTGDSYYKQVFINQADWFIDNIRVVDGQVGLWEYKFDFEYYKGLKSPWRSALAQGQGISVLARAYQLTRKEKYMKVSVKAFNAFKHNLEHPGGVTYKDDEGNLWLEELIFTPPTHVLNGFIWALWGVYDYYLLSRDRYAFDIFNQGVKTLEENINRYDMKFWSTYHLLPTRIRMIVSPYYQRLHIVQLKIMYRLTGKMIFKEYADKWQRCYSNLFYRYIAFLWKVVFKILYY
ncbi:MAG: D-glucuronyl C5-epimerase family protein [Candidatus Omnitrophica bacterium]|nr:D-glucuronyl C5-epimerase family protein [Candidatus Omnitrophota bacterium]